jgi:nucleoside 2-deoxyribosyltransferase
MKFYIAGRTSRVPEIQAMTKRLLDLGHEVAHDWTNASVSLKRPYEAKVAAQIAGMDFDGVKSADILIILGDQSGTGMYVELGIALATNTVVYSIGDYNDVTVFHFLPNVKRVETFEDVLIDLS